MERRHKSATGVATSRVKPPKQSAAASIEKLHLPNLEALIEEGQITLGNLDPVGCVVIASDEHNALAMLKRRPNETLTELLLRLDSAIDEAMQKQIFIDEINAQPSPPKRR